MNDLYKLPSGSEVPIRKMKLSDEDIILDQDLARLDKTMDILIQRVSELSESEVQNMLMGDRVALLLQLRRKSRGDLFYPQATCPHCGDSWEEEVDLSELEIQTLKKSLVDENFRFTLTLPVSGAELVVKLLRGSDEKELNKVKKKNRDRIMSYLMMIRTVSIKIGGEKKMKNINWFSDLDVEDSDYFRNEYEKRDCGVKTSIEKKCPGCNKSFEFNMPFGATFFLQTKRAAKV